MHGFNPRMRVCDAQVYNDPHDDNDEVDHQAEHKHGGRLEVLLDVRDLGLHVVEGARCALGLIMCRSRRPGALRIR